MLYCEVYGSVFNKAAISIRNQQCYFKVLNLVINKLIDKLKVNKDVLKNETCTEFEVDNWIISRFVTKKLIPIVGIHPFPISELSLMSAAVCWSKPTHIFEWGTNIGKSARIFYETCKYFKISTEIHSIDLPDHEAHVEHPKNKRGMLVKGKTNVFLYQGDGLENSLTLIKKISKPIRPLFFIDGDHSYDSVYRELKGILENIINPHILLHDTFYQSEESHYNIGPFKAIEDVFKESTNKRFKKIITNIGLPGMTFMYTIT